MKEKLLYFVIVLITIITSCQRDVTTIIDVNVNNPNSTNTMARPLSEALVDLEQTLDIIYGGTRSNQRKEYSISNVRTYVADRATRSDAMIELPDTLVYIVDFTGGQGYAVLGAQTDIAPIYSITDDGVFDFNKFTEAINYEIENNILTKEEYEQRLTETREYDNIGNYTMDDSFVYGLIASSVIGDIIDGPVIIDPTPVTPPAPTPVPPRVIERDSTKYVEFLDYYPEMMSTKWHQKDPFNLLCKDQNQNTCPTGCVVIALAQIMAYHEYPTNRAYNGVIVDWNTVKVYRPLTSYGSNHPITLQLSNLCYELGKPANCDVTYTVDGSSAATEDAVKTLANYGYKNVTHYNILNGNYNVSIINKLKNNKPIYIDASRTGGAHAWVLDGYIKRRVVTKYTNYYNDGTTSLTYSYSEPQTLFHCNFGWRGLHNGYYKVASSFDTEQRYENLSDPNYEYTPDDRESWDRYYYYNLDIITYNL